MQLRWKRLAPAETDHEALWLGVSAAGLAASAAWLGLGLPWPSCAFHALTGLPCVTCGATRSAMQFLHGHFHAAWNWNPLVFIILCGIAFFNLYAGVVLVMHGPRLRLCVSAFEKQTIRIGLVCLLVLNWAYSLGHWRDF